LPQPASLPRVAALFSLEKHELHWGGFWCGTGILDEHLHLAELPIRYRQHPNLTFWRKIACDAISVV